MNRAEETRARASSYELLALCLSPPSAEAADAASEEGGWLPLPPLDPLALAPEFHRLFVGPGALPAPPYESVYREGWRVMGETTLDVQRHYEEAGCVFVPSFNELPDHVAAELAFMAVLCEEETKAWEAEDLSEALAWLRRERAFLDDHLTRWLSAFSERLLASTEVLFYRELAGTIREFITLDLERVAALTGLLEEALA